ncbi:MAG: VanZ family protein [Pseudomonadales bacterium]
MPPADPKSPSLPVGARALFRLGFWIPLVVCTYFALATELPDNPVFRLSDIVQHTVAFTYLSVALVLLLFDGVATDPRPYLLAGLWMMGYGVLIELLQAFIPERDAELKDLFVDGVGITLGLVVARFLVPRLHGWVRRWSVGA